MARLAAYFYCAWPAWFILGPLVRANRECARAYNYACHLEHFRSIRRHGAVNSRTFLNIGDNYILYVTNRLISMKINLPRHGYLLREISSFRKRGSSEDCRLLCALPTGWGTRGHSPADLEAGIIFGKSRSSGGTGQVQFSWLGVSFTHRPRLNHPSVQSAAAIMHNRLTPFAITG